MRCAVANCRYIVESSIEDFPVCALHDAPQTRAILESGQLPAAYLWPDGRPLVLPCGELEEKHLDPVGEGMMRAGDDPRLDEVPEAPTTMVRREFDLTQE